MLSEGLSLQFFYTITPVGVEGRVGAVHLSCRNLAFSAPWPALVREHPVKGGGVSVACKARAVAPAAPSCCFGSSSSCLEQEFMGRPLGNIPHLNNYDTPTRLPRTQYGARYGYKRRVAQGSGISPSYG